MINANRSERPSISFIIPCYNEALNIAGTVAEVGEVVKGGGVQSYEIVIVNDCSTDNTGEVAASLAQQDRHIALVTNAQNLGFGGAYKEGLNRARGTYVIMIPGDNEHPYAGIIPIVRRAGEADIVIPYVSNPEARSLARRITSRAFTRLLNAVFRLDVPYFNGIVLHKLDLLKTIEIRTNGFAYQAEALIKLLKGGASYTAVPVEISARGGSPSRAFQLKNVYRVLVTIWTVWREIHRAEKRRRGGPAAPSSGAR